MRHKIGRNGEFMILFLLLAAISYTHSKERTTSLQRYCTENSSVKLLRPSEVYEISLKSKFSNDGVSEWYKNIRRCHKPFKTDPSAHFVISIVKSNIPSCSHICQCNYLQIVEGKSEHNICGKLENDYLETKINEFSLNFKHQFDLPFEVSIAISVERNAYFITGYPNEKVGENGNIIESPHFPELYPRAYSAEYILQSLDPKGIVLLMFLDFHISAGSYIEVMEPIGSYTTRLYGDSSRPPVIASQGNSLTVKFEANTQYESPGFRILSWFEIDQDVDSKEPFIECGGSIFGFGGSITVPAPSKLSLYDCIWLFKPPTFINYILSASVLELRNVEVNSSLEFREGIYSTSKLVDRVVCNGASCNFSIAEITAMVNNGFFIRFNGFVRPDSSLLISYTIYHQQDCSDVEFLCSDGRCLHPDLRCDGFKNCLDGADEKHCPEIESISVATPQDPKIIRMKHSGVTSTSLFVLVLGIGGLLLTVSVVYLAVLRTCRYCKAVSRIPDNSVNTNGTLIPQGSTEISDYSIGPPFPYDDLPSYENFIKVADQYPPLLYTKEERYSVPFDRSLNYSTTISINDSNGQQTTSLSIPLGLNRLSSSASMSHGDHAQPSVWSVNARNLECTVHTSSDESKLRRHKSLDSNLNSSNNSHETSVHLSICHPVCIRPLVHSGRRHCHSLPSNLKLKDHQVYDMDINVRHSASNGSPGLVDRYDAMVANCSVRVEHATQGQDCPTQTSQERNRSNTWSVVTSYSIVSSDGVTIVKTRCYTE